MYSRVQHQVTGHRHVSPNTAPLLFSRTTPGNTPTSSTREFLSLHIPVNTQYLPALFAFYFLICIKWYFIFVLILNYLFICVVHIFFSVCCLFFVDFQESFLYLYIKPLSVYILESCFFFHSIICLLILSAMSFIEQKSIILMQSSSLNFYLNSSRIHFSKWCKIRIQQYFFPILVSFCTAFCTKQFFPH